jgi:hypothetical protein
MPRGVADRIVHERSASPLRLRIPAALAVTVLGAGAAITMQFVGCEETPPDPIDAGQLGKNTRDASIDGSTSDAPQDAMRDAYVPPDTPIG